MPISQPELDYVRDLVYKRAAIVLEPSKQYLVESRLTPLARDEGFESIDALVARMRNQPFNGLHTRVIEAMTTNETSFFRDVHPFDALRTHVLPKIIEKRTISRSLFIWCAAASTGQEPYTIAMVIREHFPQLATWNVRILGTDLSTEVLERAREGKYRQLEVNRGLPASYLVKYFEQRGSDWQIKRELRGMVEYKQANIIEPWPAMATPDVIFVRNILIYFDIETKKKILGRMRGILAPHGALFLGGAENTLGLDDGYERVAEGRAVFYRLKSGK